MKRTLAALTLSVATPSFANFAPPAEIKTICLGVYESANGAQYAGSCDESKNNEITGAALLENGCAEGQIAVTASRYESPKGATAQKGKAKEESKFDVQIKSCFAPNIAQL
jgi:hypothetical protein